MVIDLKMWVGREHYPTLRGYIEESKTQGVSKRIPENMIPSITPGESRLFLVYPTAFVRLGNGTYWDLVRRVDFEAEYSHEEIEELDKTYYDPEDIIYSDTPLPKGLLKLKILLEILEEEFPKDYYELVERFEITFHPAVFGYCYLTGINYVVREGEEELPEKTAHLSDIVEPVRVVREDVLFRRC
jgi:hypothetical protein